MALAELWNSRRFAEAPYFGRQERLGSGCIASRSEVKPANAAWPRKRTLRSLEAHDSLTIPRAADILVKTEAVYARLP